MSLFDQFRHVDTKKAPGLYVRFERKIIVDEAPRNMAEELGQGDETDEHRAETNVRIDAFYRDEWHFVGVRAVAHLQDVLKNGSSTLYWIESAGLWGIESDCDEKHLNEVFEEQCDELRGLFAAMRESDGPIEEPNAKG